MIQININKIENLIKIFEKDINEINKNSFEKLKNIKNNNVLSHKENRFIRLILFKFKDLSLLSINLEQLNTIKKEIGKIPVTKKRVFAGKTKKSYLKDEIINALGYNKLRGSFFPKYFQKLGIKSCVYCNAQLTVTIDKGENDYKANYQLDHYFPKDKYPYLSISLLNLYPVCASCNLSKLNHEIDFELYTQKVDSNLFKFSIDPVSKARFLISRNIEDLKIVFSKRGDNNYDRIFKITEIYETQKDLVEEILLKALAYDTSYRKYLKNELSKHRISDALIDRFILGNYIKPNEVYKRPMSKLMQDIGREIGLIK